MSHQSKGEGAFNTWHIAMVHDCNLRCAYCATGYGAFGRDRGVMDVPTTHRLIDFILDHANPGHAVTVEYGGGETSLYFEQWITAMDQLREAADRRHLDVRLQSTTNGVCLDRKRMDRLAQRGVDLTFSIDGPQHVHDQHRVTATGKGSFDAALKSWSYYRSLSKRHPNRPGCNTQSVLSDNQRLDQLNLFWQKVGQPVFGVVMELPSRFTAKHEIDALQARQHIYLKDLQRLADLQAQALTIPEFLSDYRGPEDLFKRWFGLFSGHKTAPCGAGENTLAVDMQGNLYPCEGYVGLKQWQVGDIFAGIDSTRLTRFQKERTCVVGACRQCAYDAICPKSCFAENPCRTIGDNFKSGCVFAKKLSDIATHSYQLLERQTHGHG